MATNAERMEALETENASLTERLTKLEGEHAKAMDLLAQAAPLSDFEKLITRVDNGVFPGDFKALTEKVDELGEKVNGHAAAITTLQVGGDESQFAAAELVEGYDPRADLLKAFRQIEAIANHANIKLPA